MKEDIKKYFEVLKESFSKIQITDRDDKIYSLDEAISLATKLIAEQANRNGKIILIGNGASASIASHIAVDFWKNGGIKAFAFNDSSMLTCISNDYGYEHVFEKPIDMFVNNQDILIAISSSGKSENILLAVQKAKDKKAQVITLSGFSENNPLRKLGDINFYVPESEYGFVEVVHHSICHCFVDMSKK